jgi:hypothetical protein
MIEFTSVVDEHVQALSNTMRSEEVAEVYAAMGASPEQALHTCLSNAEEAVTVLDDGAVLAMVGVSPISYLGCIASPWMLTSETSRTHARDYIRYTKDFVNRWSTKYHLVNYIDARYEASIRWAKWAGFTVHPPQPHGYLRLPFHMIEIRRN